MAWVGFRLFGFSVGRGMFSIVEHSLLLNVIFRHTRTGVEGMSTEVATSEVDDRTRGEIVSLLGTGRSVREMAALVGVSPDVVLRVKQGLVDSIDAITVQESTAKALANLQTVTAKAMAEFDSTMDDRSKAPLLSAAVTATKTLMQLIDRLQAKTDDAANVLNRKRQEELVELMRRTVDRGVGEVAEQFDLDRDSLFAIFNQALLDSANEMSERNQT